jgi:Ca-activated chloride channel homolog
MNKKTNTNRSWELKLAVAVAVTLAAAIIAESYIVTDPTFAQAGRKSSDKSKKNPNASGDPDDPQKQETKVEKSLPPSTITIGTDVVNVEAVVYNKKTGAVFQGLKKEHFEIYEDGIKQEVENFATPEAPVTMVMLLEYSKLVDILGFGTGGYFENGRVEILRPAYEFVNRFVQPKDFISIVAYDIRPTPLVDFTDDKNKLMQAVSLLIRNNPAFTESNMYDALKFVLRGGKGDSVVLEDDKDADAKGQADYAGLYEVNARTAILLIGSGLDTFSKINFDEARKIVENSGVPIYVLGTGNLFMKKYDQYFDPGQGRSIGGIPFDRMTMLQAQNTLKTFATSTGGDYIPITFPGEIPSALQRIQAQVRNLYSLGYTPTNTRREGKRRKIQVKVNLGDQVDPKLIVIQHRQTYTEPKDKK